MFDLKLSPGTTKLVADQMPQDWRASRLKDFCTFTQGGRLGLTKQDNFQNAGVPAYSAAGQDGFVDRVEFHDTRAVVLSAIGANCGRCFYAEGNWTTLANVQVIIPNPNEVDARFLFYRVNRDDYWPRSGSAQPFVKPSDIKSCWVALPELVEQNSIARVLDTLDTTIRQTEAIIAKLKLVKQGLLHDLLTRGIDANGELRPPQSEAPHLYKASPLGWIPNEWTINSLDSAAEVLDPNPSHRNPIYVEQGFPFISTVEFLDTDEVETDTPRRVAESTVIDQERICAFSAGSIGFSRKGTIGETRFLPTGIRFALLDSLCVINAKAKVTPAFLMHSLRSRSIQRQIKLATMGVALPQLSIGRVRELLVLTPSLDEQQMIAQPIDEVVEKLGCEMRLLRKLQRIKAGLMDDLLTGRVRVTPLLAQATATQP